MLSHLRDKVGAHRKGTGRCGALAGVLCAEASWLSWLPSWLPVCWSSAVQWQLLSCKACTPAKLLPAWLSVLAAAARRTFEARPIFSTDEPQAAKFKLERFLHAGRQAVASVVAPIAYAPLPLLAFHRAPDGALHLAAHGALVPSCAWRAACRACAGCAPCAATLPSVAVICAGVAKALPASCCGMGGMMLLILIP